MGLSLFVTFCVFFFLCDNEMKNNFCTLIKTYSNLKLCLALQPLQNLCPKFKLIKFISINNYCWSLLRVLSCDIKLYSITFFKLKFYSTYKAIVDQLTYLTQKLTRAYSISSTISVQINLKHCVWFYKLILFLLNQKNSKSIMYIIFEILPSLHLSLVHSTLSLFF